MEAWASVVVAVVAALAGIVGTFVRASRAKSQLEILARLRQEIDATPQNRLVVQAQLQAAELHLARRIELRYRRWPRGLMYVFMIGLWAAIWTVSWFVVTIVNSFSNPPKHFADGMLSTLTSIYSLAGFAVFAITLAVTYIVQSKLDKKVAGAPSCSSSESNTQLHAAAVEIAP